MRIFLFIFFLILHICVPAQHNKVAVEITRDKRIDKLVETQKQISLSIETIPGYRVQIFFESGSNSRSKAMQVKDQFLSKYPGIEAYIEYHEPYYKIRVGNFRTRMEAQGFKQSIISEYPSTFVVKDDIILPNVE
jgi:hypothetical protein